jgi:hypothetical protein
MRESHVESEYKERGHFLVEKLSSLCWMFDPSCGSVSHTMADNFKIDLGPDLLQKNFNVVNFPNLPSELYLYKGVSKKIIKQLNDPGLGRILWELFDP